MKGAQRGNFVFVGFGWWLQNGRNIEAWKRVSELPWALSDRDPSTCEDPSTWWLGTTPNDITDMNTSHPLILIGEFVGRLQVFRIQLRGNGIQCQQPLDTTFCSYDPIQVIALRDSGWHTCGINCWPIYKCQLIEDASPSVCQFQCNCDVHRCPRVAVMFNPGYLLTTLSGMELCEVDFITDGLGWDFQ